VGSCIVCFFGVIRHLRGINSDCASAQKINVILLFPLSPHEADLIEIFIVVLLPPVSLFQNLSYYGVIVSPANEKPLKLDSRWNLWSL